MRLVKFIIPFSIFCFSFLFSFNSADAEEKISLDFEKYKYSLPLKVYNDFDYYMEEKQLDYYITHNDSSVNSSVYIVFFKKTDTSKVIFKDSGWGGNGSSIM